MTKLILFISLLFFYAFFHIFRCTKKTIHETTEYGHMLPMTVKTFLFHTFFDKLNIFIKIKSPEEILSCFEGHSICMLETHAKMLRTELA